MRTVCLGDEKKDWNCGGRTFELEAVLERDSQVRNLRATQARLEHLGEQHNGHEGNGQLMHVQSVGMHTQHTSRPCGRDGCCATGQSDPS